MLSGLHTERDRSEDEIGTQDYTLLLIDTVLVGEEGEEVQVLTAAAPFSVEERIAE
ncbi:hypothetical protein KIPB_015782, partial [Kipferlia bialata]|eukprot:g15782.t1